MKKIRFIYILPALVGLLMAGCSDDFFDTPTRAAMDETGYYSDMENLETAVVGCYSQLNAQGFIDGSIIMMFGETAGDDVEAAGAGPNDTPYKQAFDRLLHVTENEDIERCWGYGFKGIYICNQFLKNFKSETPSEILMVRIGEVKFLRALYYFLLCESYGGLPVLEEPILLSEMQNLNRGTVKDVYQLIERDLTEAIAALPSINNIDDVGRASKEAAQALLARVLIFESSYAKYKTGDARFGDVEQRWSEALKYAQDVISSPHVSLAGINGETYETVWGTNTDAYRWMFTVAGENNSGSLFEVQSVALIEGNGWLQERGSMLTKWCSFREFPNPTNPSVNTNWGWGWLAPTQALRDIFEDGDPRIRTIFGAPGDSAYVQYPELNDAGISTGNTLSGWVPYNASVSPTGYGLRKYEASLEDYWSIANGEWNRGPINEKILRLAEVYLLAAEAAFENGEAANALDYLNTVRRRADMCDGNEDGVPSQLSSCTLNDIRDERRRELTGEGYRFFDLVRWGISHEILSGHKILGGEFEVDYVDGKHDFFPIPQSEIDVLNGAIKQYDGW